VEIFKFEEEENSLLHLKTIKHELLPRYFLLLPILEFSDIPQGGWASYLL
jgi:hypothetical protein